MITAVFILKIHFPKSELKCNALSTKTFTENMGYVCIGSSQKRSFPPQKKLIIHPSSSWTSYTNLGHSSDNFPPPPWMAEISSVSGVWIFLERPHLQVSKK